MKITKFLLASAALVALASCSNTGSESSTTESSDASTSESSGTSTSEGSGTSTSESSSTSTSSTLPAITTIKVAASESPHAEILKDVIKPILAEKGYTLEVTVLDWAIQNENVYQGEYDANYFQHRPYLQSYDSGDENIVFSEDYTYTKVFPVVGVHFEPLRFYPGKSSASDFESKKTTATYCIADDSTNADRAITLLKENGVVEGDVTWENIESLYSNITLVPENGLAAALPDYDYGILPANTALTAGIQADLTLPSENDSVKALRANVVAANVSKYASDSDYKTRIDVLADAFLDDSVATYISSTYNNVVADARVDYRTSSN